MSLILPSEARKKILTLQTSTSGEMTIAEAKGTHKFACGCRVLFLEVAFASNSRCRNLWLELLDDSVQVGTMIECKVILFEGMLDLVDEGWG